LKSIKPGAKAVMPTLIAALKDEGSNPRLEAISYLGRLGPEAKEAVPELIAALKSGRGRGELGWIVEALGNVGPAAKEAVPALTEVMSRLGSRDADLGNKAMRALEKISK
jgi:HEAT repeat protein